jgi:RNA polymerase sigma-70 factor, ECF subfamily
MSRFSSSSQGLAYAMDEEQASPAQPPAEVLFERLFLEKYALIVSMLFRLTGDRMRAEELANEVFLKLYRQPVALRDDGNPGGWLYRTALNLGIDALRAHSRRKQYEQEAAQHLLRSQEAGNPLDEVLRAERRDRVRLVLAALKPSQAQILVLRHSGFSYKELAQILGLAPGSIGTVLTRAEAEFQRRYLELYGNEEEL